MKSFLVSLGVLVALIAGGMAAAPVSTPPTIAVSAGSDLRLEGAVSFDTTYPKVKNTPRIEVDCYQNGTLVYGEVRLVDEQPFILGGSSSIWVWNGGGPATCVATLFYWTFHPNQVYHFLVSSAPFEVSG